MLPPDQQGIITFIAESDYYTIQDTILELDFQGRIFSYTMLQIWPIRKPRPFTKKIESTTPILTGMRVFDTLFPIAQGGTCTIPGSFGSGKTVLCNNLTQYSNSDVVVYVACGERGNEIAEIKNEFVNYETIKK